MTNAPKNNPFYQVSKRTGKRSNISVARADFHPSTVEICRYLAKGTPKVVLILDGTIRIFLSKTQLDRAQEVLFSEPTTTTTLTPASLAKETERLLQQFSASTPEAADRNKNQIQNSEPQNP